MITQYAMHQLSNETRAKVLQVLGTMTPEQASTWMDDVKGDPAYKYMTPWHYAKVDSGTYYKPAAGGDIIIALKRAYAELQHIETLSPQRLRFDVLVLFHLCGDLVQPLHVGYGSDKGGNSYQVQYKGKGTNHHHIWDSEIIELQGIKLASFTDSIKTPATAPLQKLGLIEIDFISFLSASRVFLSAIYNITGH